MIAEEEILQTRLSSDYDVSLPTENVKRLIELKDTIREKLHPRNKPHTIIEELQMLWDEAKQLCGDSLMTLDLLDLSMEEGQTLDLCHDISKPVKDAITCWKDLEHVVCRGDKKKTSDQEKINMMICQREGPLSSKEDIDYTINAIKNLSDVIMHSGNYTKRERRELIDIHKRAADRVISYLKASTDSSAMKSLTVDLKETEKRWPLYPYG